MRRIASIVLVMAFVVTIVSPVSAQTPAAKLGRGLVNTLTGLWEWPVDILKTTKAEGPAKGLTIGFARGLATGLYRTLVGVYEVISFPVPAPAGYESITNPPTLITSDTLEAENPTMRKDFRPLSSEYEGKTKK